MKKDIADKLAIRELIENWAVWRDGLQWDRFATVWHPEGQMWATWFQGSYKDFIKVSKEGYAKGTIIHHMLGGTSIEIEGKRAVAQTKMTISQRAPVEGDDLVRRPALVDHGRTQLSSGPDHDNAHGRMLAIHCA